MATIASCIVFSIWKTQMDIHEKLYKRLLEIVPEAGNPKQYGKSKVSGLMDLNFDLIEKKGNQIIFALSHYYKHPSGDLIADPDMCIRLDRKEKAVEALSYQDTYCYREVYSEGGAVDVQAKKDLNEFLIQWLRNLREQGHKINFE